MAGWSLAAELPPWWVLLACLMHRKTTPQEGKSSLFLNYPHCKKVVPFTNPTLPHWIDVTQPIPRQLVVTDAAGRMRLHITWVKRRPWQSSSEGSQPWH